MIRFFSFSLFVILACYGGALGSNADKVYTPFFLQDRDNKQCLGKHGFTFCNENALWLLVERPETKKYSLVPFLNPSDGGICLKAASKMFRSPTLSMGSCKSTGSKKWTYEFLNKNDIKLTASGLSIARAGPYKSTMSLVPSHSDQFLPLYYYPTNIHEAGFYLKSSSDGFCFDGNQFRLCDVAKEVLFGVGVSFSWLGEGSRQFFNYRDKSSCLTTKGKKVNLGSCTEKSSLTWGLQNGQLTFNNGKMCVVRALDNSAELLPCAVDFEHIGLEVPTLHTTNDLKNALKDDKLTAPEREALQSLLLEAEAN
eukprot:CAMPEP_0114439062 /NCGR_PEP_ID=MMETSP0103-20121206/14989_1 /TAXON_ID=37642 ORGANISM="Paraphysomonas imperforata, Strain PA2" /NCGR_SAMPLE_ID=MMETSP0103 /ASSEMBLY_ACC=CAM_ASM_000201 /LENGTH=310 /DNA_ID=CAMNT_0001609781 /DNA_START=161 /DNA_END=1093 /DNA_ORIENTATION=+